MPDRMCVVPPGLTFPGRGRIMVAGHPPPGPEWKLARLGFTTSDLRDLRAERERWGPGVSEPL